MEPDGKFITALRAGEPQALAAAYDRYAPSLYGIILRIVHSETVAADILQESFVRIWRNVQQYDPDKGRLFTWMLNIARNRAIDYLRSADHKRSLKHEDLGQVMDLTDEGKSEASEQSEMLKGKLSKLPADLRQIIEGLYFRGYTQKDLADELGMTLGTLKSRLRKAMQKLKAELK